MPRGGHDIPVSGTHLKGTRWLRRVDPTVSHLKGTPWSRRVWTPQVELPVQRRLCPIFMENVGLPDIHEYSAG